MQVSVSELKDNLSKYLHIVETGENVIVTSHRVPMAKITSLVPAHTKELRLSQMENVKWNGKKPKGAEKNLAKVAGHFAAEYISEGRGK